jgi:DNA-directed RNA polymerase subunit E'/Rpb7
MDKLVDKVVIPGDVIGQVESGMTIRLGPGLIQMEESIISTKAGILRFKSPDRFWIENNQKRVSLVDRILDLKCNSLKSSKILLLLTNATLLIFIIITNNG